MARYDPYDRGDNPHRIDIDRIDMPRSKPSAKPKAGGASKSAAAPAKKKAAPASPPRRPKEITPEPSSRWADTLSPRDLDILTGPAAQPSEGPFPPALPMPPRVTGPESTAALAMPPRVTGAEAGAKLGGPEIPSGLLAGPTPGYRPPESARSMMGGIFDTGPIDPRASAPAPIQGGPGTMFDTGPVTPMQTPDWLRRLISGLSGGGGSAPTGGMPTGMP